MKPLLMVIGAVLAALVCGAAGGYVLWQFHTVAGLVVGVGLVLLALAIALPTQLKSGTMHLKDGAGDVTVIVQELKGAESSKDKPCA